MLAFHGYCGVVFACSEESTLIITFSITGRVYSMLSLYVYFETLSACSRESTLITDQIAGIVYCFYHALVHVYRRIVILTAPPKQRRHSTTTHQLREVTTVRSQQFNC